MTCALPVTVPVVDFSACSLERDTERVPAEELRSLSAQLHDAFTRVGFVFLQNTGISQSERPLRLTLCVSCLRLNPSRPGDLKESFNTTLLSPSVLWPTGGALSDFQQLKSSFFRRCSALGLQVLRLMPLSLGLEEETFVREHQRIGGQSPGNSTTLRSLFYPPIDPDSAKPGQLRCGEHSDYGSITLLFQSSPGIQVRSVSGQFLQVPLVPGAVLVNIADLMQRWTSDAFVSAVHRVLLPPAGDASERQSLAFFMQPDDSAVIGCCDGSDKYPPITSEQYLRERYADTY
uniref:Si:dkey-10o6.2 n=1 Tax=Neogobius melanostomus TaxID=47308 RepID=A0A8C6TUM9_9GOBI